MTSETLQLAIELIKRPSLTPHDEGCQALIAEQLKRQGFTIELCPFGAGQNQVQNLWATHGNGEPVLCFVGHTDVVPTGDLTQWHSPPFEPTLKGEYLYGRGAADMKGGLAAMIIAVQTFVKQHPHHQGTIAILLTSDEEGPSEYGIKAVVEYFKKINRKITWAVIGEPSSQLQLGDTIKHGRRGSLGGQLTIHGKQGHIAYPQLANNPISLALPALSELNNYIWDQGTSDFDPTRFQISNIHAGTGANNVIPNDLQVVFNLRFSPSLTPEHIQHTVKTILDKHQLTYTLQWHLSGLPFITDKNSILLKAAIFAIQQQTANKISPLLSTSGGTSDGRFITTLGTDVIELGPVNATVHQINECVKIQDLDELNLMYQIIIRELLLY